MVGFKITKKQRLYITIAISFSFFLAELVVGFITHSLALVADAFHYLSDLIGITVALVAAIMEERQAPNEFTFGYQRASLLGAFFNGVFLLALSISILVQAVERFVDISEVKNPKLVLIVGCIGFGLNVLVMSFLHEHDHSDGGQSLGHGHSHGGDHFDKEHQHNTEIEITTPTHQQHKHNISVVETSNKDLGMLGVFVHVLGDAINNIGVIISAVIIWKAKGHGRYYIDPAVSMFIAIMIFIPTLPLTKKSGSILLQVAPAGVDTEHVRHDMEQIPGVKSVHELHIWRLDQRKTIASAHIVLGGKAAQGFAEKAKVIMECLHAYGIHSATLQPEITRTSDNISHAESEIHSTAVDNKVDSHQIKRRNVDQDGCQLICGNLCETKRCC